MACLLAGIPCARSFTSGVQIMKFNDAIAKLKFDKRMVNWNIKQNVLTEKELKEHIAGLDDLTSRVGTVQLDESATFTDTSAANGEHQEN